MKKLAPTLALVLAASSVTLSANPHDWPRFRGPDQDGTLHPGVLAADSFGLEVGWIRELGKGYAAVSIVGDRGVTLFTNGTTDFVLAFDVESGDDLWSYPLAEMYRGHDGSDDGPISTPTIHNGIVYTLGPRGHLVALRLTDGNELWKVVLDGETNSAEPIYGYSTVPLIVDDKVIVLTGAAGGRTITAFDAATGTLVWSAGDDHASYQSPVLAELAGQRQIVASSDHDLFGLDPATGAVLWNHRHSEGTDEGFQQPVVLPEGRFLLNFFEDSALFQVTRREADWNVEQVWRTRDLKRSYALPVYLDGYLYGFNGRFLSCIDPATGEAVWRSRPPGGQGLIAVDGRLVLTSAEGDFVVAEANPDSYRELARIPLLDAASITTPSFAGEYFYVRDARELARVRVTDQPTAQMTSAPTSELQIPPGAFGDFLRSVLAADSAQRSDMLDGFFAAHSSFPIFEEEGRVHFVYRGAVEDVALQGSMITDTDEIGLQRVADTDLYFHTMQLDPEGHWEYRYSINFGDQVRDPLNPLAIGSLNGPSSELRMPGWPVPDHLGEPTGARGRIDSFTFTSTGLDNEREIQVWLPPGYDLAENGERRYPLVLFHNGDSALEQANIDRSLDNLIGHSVQPVIVALLPRVGAEFGGATADAYVTALTGELIPHLDRTYRTTATPSDRAVLGVGSGAYISAYAAFQAPGTFGKVATQSLYINAATRDAFLESLSGERQDLDLYIEWSRHDYNMPAGGIDAAADSAELADALSERGYEVRRHQVTGAAGWGSWRATIDEILEYFYPL